MKATLITKSSRGTRLGGKRKAGPRNPPEPNPPSCKKPRWSSGGDGCGGGCASGCGVGDEGSGECEWW